MSKIMLVEDDNNLREIYEARLLAEGYEIVSAKDGEEALAMAVKEKPDLIISDVMMPKISGFDMLDILRSTPETKDTKVIMMTALSQAEDKTRADKLGADRYLVKSQVTLEDVAAVAKEVLTGESATPAQAPDPITPAQSEPVAMAAAPSIPDPAPVVAPDPIQTAPAPSPDPMPPTSSPDPTATPGLPADPIASPPIDPVTAPDPMPPTQQEPDAFPKAEPADNEPANLTVPTPTPNNDVATLAETTTDEQELVDSQIESFVETQDAGQPAPEPEAPVQQPVSSTAPPSNNIYSDLTPEVANIDVKQGPAADGTNQAADTAEKLATAVNDMLQPNEEAASQSETTTNPVAAGNKKKIINPINDLSQKPDLARLAQEEEAASQTPTISNAATPQVAPVVIPDDKPAPPPASGTVIQPGNDPDSIAL